MVSHNAHCLLVFCVVLGQVHTAPDWPSINNDNLALAEFTVFIARQHLSKASNTLIVVEKTILPSKKAINTQVLEYILINLRETVAVQLYFGQLEDEPWEYHIFVIDNYLAFMDFRWKFPTSCYGNKYHFIIVLTKFVSQYLLHLKSIFKFCYQFHVINVNVILNHPTDGVSMYTYQLFSEELCRVVQPVLYFRMADDLENLTQIFPPKLRNFHGCPVRVIARENPPLVSFTGNRMDPKPVGNWENLEGIDGQLIKSIAKTLNFTIELLPFPTELTYFDNHTGYGCFAALMNGRADIAIGGYSASDPNRCLLSVSELYHQSPVVFVVRGGRLLSSVKRLATPFQSQVWYVMAIFLIISFLVILVLRAGKPAIRRFVLGAENNDPVTNFFAMFLGYPVGQLPRRNFARYVLGLWLLMTVVFRNAYQGSLYDSIRMDRFVRLPVDYEELQKWNYQIMVSKYISGLGMFPKNQTIVLSGGHGVRLRELDSKLDRYATVVLRDHFVGYMKNHYRKGSKLKMVDEPVYMFLTVMYFEKHSIYTTMMNKKLRQFLYGGITRHIARSNSKEIEIFKDHKKGASQKAICIDRLRGLFEIYVCMMLVAVTAFFCELLSMYWSTMRTVFEWVN